MAVDCTAISPALFESELFGHVAGAFTGAIRNNQGLFRTAGTGTVFLDEVTETPLALQAKLLRAVQEREVRPVGATRYHRTEARIIASTNRDPHKLIKDGALRQDLYYRLSVISIHLPPLRDRRDDIVSLAKHFIDTCPISEAQYSDISDEALAILHDHSWPGNVRELQNCIERACAMGTGERIDVADLPGYLRVPSAPPILDLAARRREADRQAIREALERAGNNRSEAARLLGMGRTTLYRKMNRLGIKPV